MALPSADRHKTRRSGQASAAPIAKGIAKPIMSGSVFARGHDRAAGGHRFINDNRLIGQRDGYGGGKAGQAERAGRTGGRFGFQPRR
jgi:hypothetical protein